MYLFSTQIAYAASSSLTEFIGKVNTRITNPLIEFLFALAVVYFLYGVFEFLANQDNDEKKTTGKQHMLWGIIGITIMMAVFMIMSMILTTFGITGIDVQQGTVDLQ